MYIFSVETRLTWKHVNQHENTSTDVKTRQPTRKHVNRRENTSTDMKTC